MINRAALTRDSFSPLEAVSQRGKSENNAARRADPVTGDGDGSFRPSFANTPMKQPLFREFHCIHEDLLLALCVLAHRLFVW